MSTDLHARATAQQQKLEAAAAEVTDGLAAARDELGRRHADPGALDRQDWAAELGASQHRQIARDELEAVREDQVVVRDKLARIANPAEASTFEEQLRELMIDEAALRVELRHGAERVHAAEARIAALDPLATAVEAEVRAAADRTAWGRDHATRATSLRSALEEAPLDTIVDDAAAALGGATFSAAADRLNELLPSELRDRAEQRAVEAAEVVTAARDAVDRARTEADTVATAARPVDAGIEIGERALLAAEDALTAYESTAAGRLEWATAALARVADLPDLTDDQAEAVDPASNGDGVAGAGHEGDLAAAVAAAAAAQRAIDDAILAARLADPDADPDADPAVSDAREALADASIQDPLSDARGNYDAAAQRALDEWEVEVPGDLWSGLEDFVAARRALEELSSSPARTALVQALDDAEDALATALDQRDRDIRARWALGVAEADRAATAAAATAVADDRRRQYLQGDGPSGRVPAEL